MKDYFTTADVGLIAYLLTAGYVPTERTLIKNRLLALRFKQTPELEQDCSRYFDGKTSVDAQTYFSNLENVKAQIRSMSTMMKGGVDNA